MSFILLAAALALPASTDSCLKACIRNGYDDGVDKGRHCRCIADFDKEDILFPIRTKAHSSLKDETWGEME
jgi:hypothetical protein